MNLEGGVTQKQDDLSRRGAGAALLAVLGAVSSIIGTYERFALGGAVMIAGLLLVLIAAYVMCYDRFAWFRTAHNWVTAKPNNIVLSIGAILLVLGAVLWFFGAIQARFWRKDFSAHHTTMRLAESDYASDFFRRRGSSRLRDRRSADRNDLECWIRWMCDGADDASTGGAADKPPPKRLAYLESQAFDSDYATIEMQFPVATGTRIHESAVFLMANTKSGDIWYKPAWRQLYSEVNDDGGRLSFVVNDPNNGDRVVVFFRISAEKGYELPQADRIIPGFEIGLRP